MKINKTGMQWLRVLHILSAGIWLGSVVCILSLAAICFFQLSDKNFLTIAPLVPELYQKVVLPTAIFTIIQGIIYGVFTHWGFIRYRWVIFKWIFVLPITLCTGLGTIGQMFAVLVKVETAGFSGGLADGGLVLFFISLQVLFMLIMIIFSVFKPKLSNPITFPKGSGSNSITPV